MSPRVQVVVQSVVGRSSREATLRSLQESDTSDVIVVNDEAGDMRRTFLRTMELMAGSSADLVVRLEDDVLVNRHLSENVLSWDALNESDFGAGWLWQSLALFKQCRSAKYSSVTRHGNVRRMTRLTTGSLGVVMRPVVVRSVLPLIATHWDRADVKGQQDLALTSALFELGRHVYLHSPPLVEHNVAHPSLLAPDRPVDPFLHTTGGRFDVSWRRNAKE